MWGWRSSRTPVVLTATAVFAVVCLLPLLYMLSAALAGPRTGVSRVGVALLDRRQSGLLYNTICLGMGTTVLASAIGAPLGFALARLALPFTAILRIVLAAPALLPPYVIAMAMTYLVGSLASTLTGAIVALTVGLYPITMLVTEVAVRRVEPRLEEAALLVTTPGRVLARITWPIVAPSVIAAALIIFVLAISEFSVPGLLRVRVYTTEVFTAFAALYDFGRAASLAGPLLIVSIAVAASAGRRLGRQLIATRRGLHGDPLDTFQSWRPLALASIGCLVVVVLAAPLAVLAREALRAESIGDVLRDSRDAAIHSLLIGLTGASAVTLVAVCLGHARARATPNVGAMLDALWVAQFAVPSTVIGIGLIGVWNRPGAGGALYGTPAMLLLGYLARFLPIGALSVAAIVRSIPESHEEAAAVVGGGWLRTMVRIVIPQMRAGLLAVWVVAFVLGFGEVGTSILVAPPGESTLPIRVYTLTANAPPGYVPALALFQSAIILAPVALLAVCLGRRRTS